MMYTQTAVPSQLFPPSHYYSQQQHRQQHQQHYPLPQYRQESAFLLGPKAFRDELVARLAELTVNSRPAIQDLSTMAQDYSRYADIVVERLEWHITHAPAWMKLPAWYLLDALSKNIREPYARLFASIITPLFLNSHASVDQNTRRKMEEMLLTWRSGAPAGREVFGVGPQVAIERSIWGSAPAGTPFISSTQVLGELASALGEVDRVLYINPYNTQANKRIGVLQQLRTLVEAGVSQEQLHEILNQLRTLPPVPVSVSLPTPPSPIIVPPPPSVATPTLVPRVTAPSSNAVTQTSPSSTSTPTLLPNISNLFETLVKAGVVSSNTLTGAGQTTLLSSSAKALDIKPVLDSEDAHEQARAHRDLVLSQGVQLTSIDITKRRPNIVSFLYDHLPVQCKQCGVRFADSASGRKDMQEHLDMHFRQNRRASGEQVGRGYSRSWFVQLQDWICDHGKGKGPGELSRQMDAKALAANDAAKHDAELRAQFVVILPGDEVKTISCPVCKETLPSEFQEEEEEWVWMNAVKVDDKIYHATCREETLASATALANKLRNGLKSHSRTLSRSATPERLLISQTTPPKSATPTPQSSPRSPTNARAQASASVHPRLKRKFESVDREEESGEGLRTSKKMVSPVG